MKTKHLIIYTLLSFTFLFSITSEQKQLADDAMFKMMQKIYSETIKYKQAMQTIDRDREELLSNLASSAPRSPFVINADLDASLLASNPEALIYLSTNNQQSWSSAPAFPLNSDGYENTWASEIENDGSNSVQWYVEGQVDSDVLGFDFGRIYVTQSPKYDGFSFDPPDNYFQTLVDEDTGETGSSQDITDVQGTFKDDRLYSKMTLSGGCCDEGGLFGPWYLYGVGFFNPDSESEAVYALGYGDGGFGQLTPGLLKITGDISTGEIGGFEYLTTNINYVTSGNNLYLSCLTSYLLDDPDFGPWPNSLGGGLAVVGVTVQASLDGLDVAADVLDQTNPGVHILSTESQEGNFPLTLSNPTYDDDTRTLTVDYIDSDGNLPWFKSGQICYPNGGECFLNIDMIPSSHSYIDGCSFSGSFNNSEVESGNYEAKFWFIDSSTEDYPVPQLVLPISVDGGENELIGDINNDDTVNVLDVVLLVNMILTPGTETDSADLNDDGVVNVLDVVLLVNIILTP
tara:strand:+ start:1185 stop:2729 length:1545 start_codon:yes stop_codon:yes gene_type:complete